MARKLTTIPGLLGDDDEPPAPTPTTRPARSPRTARSAPPSTPPPDPVDASAEDDSPRLVRSTLDLPADRHAELLRFAIDAGTKLGWPVRPQFVVRALVDQLLTDPATAQAVRQRLQAQGRPTRRRNT